MRRTRYVSLLFSIVLLQPQAQELTLPLKNDSVRFAVIGDSGTGKTPQYELAAKMSELRQKFPFEFVLMLGDNMYGGESPRDFEKKFERPYKPLLDAGVKFYAALGNHDNPNQRFYKPFNMDGKQYYTYKKGPIRFFAMDSNYVDRAQLQWIEKELQNSDSVWKICYFHHPLYSSGARHGSDTDLRLLLEPLFIKYGVNVVLAGHEHFYERIKPQNGIYYFTSGAASKLRRGNIRKSILSAKGFDQDLSFMLMEVSGDQLHFQVISRDGRTIDGGTLERQTEADRAQKASQWKAQVSWESVSTPDETLHLSRLFSRDFWLYRNRPGHFRSLTYLSFARPGHAQPLCGPCVPAGRQGDRYRASRASRHGR